MLTTLIIYALEVLCCSGFFLLFYRLFFSKSTHFQGMRFYLLGSLVLPFFLPILPISALELPFVQDAESIRQAGQTFSLNTGEWFSLSGVAVSSDEESANFPIWVILLFGLYGIGVIFRFLLLLKRLYTIWEMLRISPKERRDGYCLVWPAEHTAPFSFLHYLFLGKQCKDLSQEELEQVRQHELVHIRQRHSFDLLLLEVADIFFWFNIFHRYLRYCLQEVHEYLADEAVSKRTDWKDYARLLLKMSAGKESVALSAAFTARQISRRILMLGKERSPKWKRMGFAGILPMSASLLFLFSCVEEVPESYTIIDTETGSGLQAEVAGLKIGSISWEGNQLYSDAQLSEVFGINSGNLYDSAMIAQRLHYQPKRTSVSDLYMDEGYLFFSLEIETQERAEGVVDLQMKIFEGDKVRLGKIIVRGNERVATEEILEQIDLHEKELFSRQKLIDAQRKIAEMGYFDPKNVHVNPLPDPENGTLDVEFVVSEL